MSAVRYFSRNMSYGKGSREEQISRLRTEIEEADAVVIGAGAGLSTSAGLTYSGERFEKYFFKNVFLSEGENLLPYGYNTMSIQQVSDGTGMS